MEAQRVEVTTNIEEHKMNTGLKKDLLTMSMHIDNETDNEERSMSDIDLAQNVIREPMMTIESPLSLFNKFVKENVEKLTVREFYHIQKYKMSCRMKGALFIPRSSRKSKYKITIVKLLASFLHYAEECSFRITEISDSKILFKLTKATINNDHERLTRILYSEIVSINSLTIHQDKNIEILSNPTQKTIKFIVKDHNGLSEVTLDNFAPKDVFKKNTIEDADEDGAKKMPGTVRKINYRLIMGIHKVAKDNNNNNLVDRYHLCAKTLDRYLDYGIIQSIDWDSLMKRNSYNLVG